MDAAILCGGMGTRLGLNTQKCVAPVNSYPFLHYLLDQVSPHVDRIVLCTGYKSINVEFAALVWMAFNAGEDVVTSQEKEPLGTFGAVRNALPFLRSDEVFVLNGDTYSPMRLDHWLPCASEMLSYNNDLDGVASTHGVPNGYRLINRESIELGSSWDDFEWFEAPTTAPFLDIGTPEGYARADEFMEGI